MRSSSCGSLVTDLPPGEKRRPSPANSAWPAYCMCSRRNMSRSGKVCSRGISAPPSRREMSSIALKDRSSPSIASIRLRASGSSGERCSRLCSVAANSPRAWTGWRRSWLAMARKRLLSWSVRRASASSRSSSPERSICCSSATIAWRRDSKACHAIAADARLAAAPANHQPGARPATAPLAASGRSENTSAATRPEASAPAARIPETLASIASKGLNSAGAHHAGSAAATVAAAASPASPAGVARWVGARPRPWQPRRPPRCSPSPNRQPTANRRRPRPRAAPGRSTARQRTAAVGPPGAWRRREPAGSTHGARCASCPAPRRRRPRSGLRPRPGSHGAPEPKAGRAPRSLAADPAACAAGGAHTHRKRLIRCERERTSSANSNDDT